MPQRGRRWRYGKIVGGLFVVILAVLAVLHGIDSRRAPDRRTWEALPTTPVRRADLWASVTSAGLVGSANQTIVECDLESLEVGVRGRSMSAGGASVILSLVPDGTTVKSGDVLCRLDASDYEELARQQEMNVERAKADYHQAELDLEVAKLAVGEFRQGLWQQSLKEFENQIAMARSEWDRAVDRLAWSRRMLEKRYVSLAQFASDTFAERRAAFLLAQSQINEKVYRKLTAARIDRELGNAQRSAQAMMDYQTARLQRHRDRLDNLNLQIERCTIRAPHDGFVIYANDPRRQFVLEPGISVRQKQRLFYLPDLAKMEVSALLHETVVDRVSPGMRSKVRVEGLSKRILEGHVVSVARIPTRTFLSEVTYYAALIAIDSPPRGLLPGMSAEIQIATARRPDVLTIPTESVTIEDGQDVCYVADEDGLERREVTLGQATTDHLEVTKGLGEGEQVVLNPLHLDEASKADAETVETPEDKTSEDFSPIAATH